MSFRSAIALVLCISLLLPGAAHAAANPGVLTDAAAILEDASTEKADCHHARAVSAGEAVANTQTAAVPASMDCCGDCDCGCVPATALPMADRAALALSGAKPARSGAMPVSSGDDDRLLRPPIA